MLTMKKMKARNQRGMAMIEALPLLVIFVMLLSFAMGFFGIIHTAVLSSIAARTYAFETFRNRSNLKYYREDGSALDAGIGPLYLGEKGFRYHAIQHESDNRPNFVATSRPLTIGANNPNTPGTGDTHNSQVYTIQDKTRNQKVDVSPAWIMVGYGICLDPTCGGQ
jgi:hypothetical protein